VKASLGLRYHRRMASRAHLIEEHAVSTPKRRPLREKSDDGIRAMELHEVFTPEQLKARRPAPGLEVVLKMMEECKGSLSDAVFEDRGER
jgi:hypothetical protein